MDIEIELDGLRDELSCAESDYDEAHAEARRLTFVIKDLQSKIDTIENELVGE